MFCDIGLMWYNKKKTKGAAMDDDNGSLFDQLGIFKTIWDLTCG